MSASNPPSQVPSQVATRPPSRSPSVQPGAGQQQFKCNKASFSIRPAKVEKAKSSSSAGWNSGGRTAAASGGSISLLPSVDQLSVAAFKGIQPLQTFHQYYGPSKVLFSSPLPHQTWDYSYSTPTSYARSGLTSKRSGLDLEEAGRRPWASVPSLRQTKTAASLSISEEDEVELVDTILQLKSRLS